MFSTAHHAAKGIERSLSWLRAGKQYNSQFYNHTQKSAIQIFCKISSTLQTHSPDHTTLPGYKGIAAMQLRRRDIFIHALSWGTSFQRKCMPLEKPKGWNVMAIQKARNQRTTIQEGLKRINKRRILKDTPRRSRYKEDTGIIRNAMRIE